MDRATNSHSGMIHSNKKPNESLKLTESYLCDEIHDNLRTLALIHPLSDEFKNVFEKVSDLLLSLNQLIARFMKTILFLIFLSTKANVHQTQHKGISPRHEISIHDLRPN